MKINVEKGGTEMSQSLDSRNLSSENQILVIFGFFRSLKCAFLTSMKKLKVNFWANFVQKPWTISG